MSNLFFELENQKRRKSCFCFDSGDSFTLLELLIVVAVLVIMISLLLPALGKARELAKGSACLSNLKQIGLAQAMYSGEQDDFIVACTRSSNTDSGMIFSNSWFGVLSGTSNDGSSCSGSFGVKFISTLKRGSYDCDFKCPAEPMPMNWGNGSNTMRFTHYAVGEITKKGNPEVPYYRKLSQVTKPGECIFAGDCGYTNTLSLNGWGEALFTAFRHGGGNDFSSSLLSARTKDGILNAFPSLTGTTNLVYIDGHAAAISLASLLEVPTENGWTLQTKPAFFVHAFYRGFQSGK